ncbi:hypothetical protein CVT23_11860 [Minwuia thermotolerans]|uniref:Outer membrane protein beta-barrel domain-containing protein n=2 Tax=Minwuia thermotolerans TaxID=2056226 RepID=A0A2M9G1X8_9PROT|nr:hypothetical protein CVT23_11860 [Minwuia thermotolerans]
MLGLGAAAYAPLMAAAQDAGQIAPAVESRLAEAAEGGPGVLLCELRAVLAADPALAATPDSAAALARAAAVQVRQYRGANLPVYREIVAVIGAAAPAEAEQAVISAAGDAVTKVAITDPSVAGTGQYTERPEGDRKTTAPQPERQVAPLGVRVGNMIVYPEVQVSTYYDDNIFGNANNEVDDVALVIGPHVFVQSDWERHAAFLQGHVDVVRYRENDDENSVDYWASGEGRLDVTDRTKLFGGALHGAFHEDRESPDDQNGAEPTRYSQSRAFAGLAQGFGKTRLRLGGTVEHLDFDDTPLGGGGVINNDDRDRNLVSAGALVAYRLSPQLEPYAEAIADYRRYNADVDDNGFDRDSAGYTFKAGATYEISGELFLDVAAGVMYRNFEDQAFDSETTPALDASLTWNTTPELTLRSWVSRSISDTTVNGASHYNFTGGGLTAEYDITQDLLLSGLATYGVSAFEGANRTDHDYEFGAGLRYRINRNFFVAGDLRHQFRESDVVGADFTRNQVFLRFGAQY